MKSQSNPVLFIFLGSKVSLCDGFAEICADYGMAGSAAYIRVHEHPHDEWFKDEINRVQKDFIRRTYGTNGVIRVSYVLGGDDWDLPKLRATVDKYLAMLYPLEIYTDVYWLVDDANAFDSRTDAQVRMMALFNGSGLPDAQVYIISNLDSNNSFAKQEDVLRTVALISLFKDFEPGEYPVPPDASRYNDFLFAENAHAPGKRFFTAACRSLEIPREALRAYLVGLMLDFRPPFEDKFDIDGFLRAEIPDFAKIVGRDYVYGLAVPSEVNRESFVSRAAAIERLFGERLDGVLEIYGSTAERSLDALRKAADGLPFYEAAELFGGGWREAVNSAIDENAQSLSLAEDELRRWLAGELGKDGAKRRLSFWQRQDAMPFRLAMSYLERANRIHALRVHGGYLTKVLGFIDEYHGNLLEYMRTVRAAREGFRAAAAGLDAAFETFLPGISKFFAMPQFDAEPMARHLRDGSFSSEYLVRLEAFAEKQLPELLGSFGELLGYIADRAPLPQLLAEWAIRGRRYGVSLKTGDLGLYSEASIYMPGAYASDIKAAYESQGLGRVNLFADSRASRIDILYQAGTFNLDDLYYKDLYV